MNGHWKVGFVWIIITFTVLCNFPECPSHPPLGVTSATKNQCWEHGRSCVWVRNSSEIIGKLCLDLAVEPAGILSQKLGRRSSLINNVSDWFPTSPASMGWLAPFKKKKKKWRGQRKKPATQAVKPWPCKEKACAGLCKQSVVCQGWPGRASWAMSRAQFPSHCGGCPRAHSPLLMWTTGSGWEDAPCPQSETTTTFPAGWAINHTKCFIKLWVPVRPPRTGQEEGSSDERTGFAELSQI